LGFHDHELANDMQTNTSKLMRLVQHPLPRVLFWLLIIVIYEAIQLPWRWRSLRARL
jgi:hypothetical protein